MLVRSLRDAGFHVTEARTGAEALDRARDNPDLITLDVNLPDIHGFDLCKKLKSNPATSHIPILHLSSTFIDAESRVHGLASGADAYLAEPIDRAELVATIEALLRLKNAEARAGASAGGDSRERAQRIGAAQCRAGRSSAGTNGGTGNREPEPTRVVGAHPADAGQRAQANRARTS